ncbi:YcjF family protein [Paracoccaceae bacterium GXU_MW_L88]
MADKPMMFDVEGGPENDVNAAPPVPDLAEHSTMARATRIAARKPSRLWGIFWAALAALVGLMISLWTWSWITELLASHVWLGRVALALVLIVLTILLLFALREFMALMRLSKIDDMQAEALVARSDGDREKALTFSRKMTGLYSGRDELAMGRQEVDRQAGDIFETDAILDLTERELLEPLDQEARRAVEAAARQVAAVTAIVPLAFADIFVALAANARMVRQIAEIYGGRAGMLGGFRLLRIVAAHLVATGAVAVGDDMIEAVAGGGVLSRVSRRFGEGTINGALTARVGIAAMEVCRPMGFNALPRPRVTALLRRSLTGLFNTSR